MQMSRLLRNALVATAFLSLGSGCGRCGADRPGRDSGSAEQVERVDPAVGLAQLVPADAVAYVGVRNLAQLSSQFAALRPRLNALLGNIGMIETDLRNTLGIDVARLDDLSAIGVEARDGIGLAVSGADAFVFARLSNRETFVAHVTRVAQGQPFNLAAPVEEVTVGDATILRFRRAAGDNVKLSIALRRDVAYLLGDARTDEALLTRLAAVTTESSLGGQAALQAAAARFASSIAVVWLSPEAATDLAGTLLGNGANGEAARQSLRELGTISAGLRLRADAIELETVASPTGEAGARLAATMAPSGTNPEFGRLVGNDTYMIARSSLDTTHGLATLRRILPATAVRDLDAALALVETHVGMNVETDLLPALGRNVIALATRARMLTLRRVIQSNTINPGEAASAFGLIVALDINDRAQVERFLDGMVNSLEGRAEKFTSNGYTVVGFTDQQSDIGNLVLTDRMLMLVPSRNREDLMAQLASGSATPTLRTESASSLVSDATATGIYIDVAAVIGGPIGATLGPMVPDQVMRAIGNLDHVLIRSDLADGTLTSRMLIQLSATPAGTEGSGAAGAP